MFSPVGVVCVSLGSVVLDRPDHTGVYIAKDLVAGWAYHIADSDGDTRYRGHGVCAGGLDVALRCALLCAASYVPDSAAITILVDTQQSHRTVVKLVTKEAWVMGAIAGRPVTV